MAKVRLTQWQEVQLIEAELSTERKRAKMDRRTARAFKQSQRWLNA